MELEANRPDGPLAALFAGERLDQTARADITSAGATFVPALLEILRDEELAKEGSRGDGWAPIHAAVLLAEGGALEAIGPMLQVFVETSPDELLHETIVGVLPYLGAAILEPVLVVHDEAEDDEVKDECCEMLARCEAQDLRIRARLFAAYERAPELFTPLLGTYGDRAGAALARRTFDRYAKTTTEDGFIVLRQALDALEDLDAATDDHRAAVRRAEERLDKIDRMTRGPLLPPLRPAGAITPAQRRERPGRNEPCWCGSGKKYKRCHADADDREEREALDRVASQSGDAALADALLELGSFELDDFAVSEVEERERFIGLLALAWNIASFEKLGRKDDCERLRAELDDSEDAEELHELLEELVERKQDIWPDDVRFVMDARIVDGELAVVARE